MYDVTDYDTFVQVSRWMEELRRFAPSDITILLVGNKADMESQRAVKKEEAQKLAEDLKVQHLECSAKTGLNVDLVFQLLVDTIMKRTEEKHKTMAAKRENDAPIYKGQKSFSLNQFNIDSPHDQNKCSC